MARTGMKAFIQVAILAVFVRVILLVYGAWQDKYLEVKYTDVDYWVVADAANALMVGKSPYIRSTYRYTPVLAAMLVPNSVFGEWWGKSLFAACDLLVGYLIYLFLVRTTNPSRAARLVAVFWLFNPAVFTVSTRGNCESVLCTFILGGLYFLTSNRIALAGVFYGLAVHFKLFPVIYGVAILSYLVCGEKSRKVIESPPMSPIMKSSVASPISSTESSPSVKERKKQKAVKPIEELVSQHAPISTPQKVTHLSPENSTGRIKNILIFGLSSLLSFGLLTGICYYLYGEQYIQEAFTYHLTRRDHRHNFSPYFYLFYTDSVMKLPKFFEFLVFIPQILIFIFAGIKFGRRDLAFACFIITFVFVTFNKYFIWYMSLFPIAFASLHNISGRRWIAISAFWGGSYLLWLNIAYKLEFLGQEVFTPLWAASILFMLANTWVGGQFIRHRFMPEVLHAGPGIITLNNSAM